jgi:tight adherence protein C
MDDQAVDRTMMPDRWRLIYAMAGLALTALLGAVFLLIRGARQHEMHQRIDTVVMGIRSIGPAAEVSHGFDGILSVVGHLGERIRRRTKLYSEQDMRALYAVLQGSGFNPRRALPIMLGMKILLLVLLPAAAFGYGSLAHLEDTWRLGLLAFSLPLGLLGPDWVLGIMRRRYEAHLRRGVPDALDLMVVCTEAGMGLESALEQVSRELRHSNRPMSMVLSDLLDQLHILPDRRDAFANLGNRGVDGLRRMATMLAQSQQYGTPLGQALRAVAGELRRDYALKMEERAARLPAMLIFPLILFIMPTLFIVLVGPGMMRFMASLNAISH